MDKLKDSKSERKEKDIFVEPQKLPRRHAYYPLRTLQHGYQRIAQDVYRIGMDVLKHPKTSKSNALTEAAAAEGMKELIKEDTKVQETARVKLQELASRNDVILMKVRTLFPFDFFPDTLIIDMTKVNILSKHFWATETITNLNLKDIIDVSVETAWFMGNLVITYVPNVDGAVGMVNPSTHKISLLKCKDALRAQRILKGILVARREGIEISKCTPEELMNVVERFGDYK